MGKDNSLHSTTSVKNGVSQHTFPGLSALHQQQSLCACPRSLGALASSPGARAGMRFAPCPALVGMPRAARSAGLQHRLQVSPQELQPGKPHRETTAHPDQELVAVGWVVRAKLLARGRSKATRLLPGERGDCALQGAAVGLEQGRWLRIDTGLTEPHLHSCLARL